MLSRPARHPRKAHATGAARLQAQTERGEINDSPSPSSSVSSLSPPGRRTRSSTSGGRHKKGVAGGQKRRTDKGRSKNGCWSCRIRRKKCSGRLKPDDACCVDCTRLHIKCLGWGDKRPDWLREPGAVQKEREIIKQTLLKQGKVKGHKKEDEDVKPKLSPSSPSVLLPSIALNDEEIDPSSEDDGSESELDFVEEDDLPSTSTPPSSQPSSERDLTPSDSNDDAPAVDDEDVPQPTMPELVADEAPANSSLNFRGGDAAELPPFLAGTEYSTGSAYSFGYEGIYQGYPGALDLSFDAVTQNHLAMVSQNHLDMNGNLNIPTFNMLAFDTSLLQDPRFELEHSTRDNSPMDLMEHQFTHMRTMGDTSAPLSPIDSQYIAPEMISTISPVSPLTPPYQEFYQYSTPPPPQTQPIFFRNGLPPQYSGRESNLFQYYLNHVLPLQNPLKPNQRKRDLMIQTAGLYGPEASPTMMCLALLHRLHTLLSDRNSAEAEINAIYRERNDYWTKAKESLFSSPKLDLPRALLALQMYDISVLTGCAPNIEYFRYVAILQAFCNQYVPSGNAQQLLGMMAQDNVCDYLVKSAFWMDIVCAISKKTEPRFLGYFRQMASCPPGQKLPLDMSDLVGCPTEIMFAFAEIASLEMYKEKNNGALSMAELVKRADGINNHYLRVHNHFPLPAPPMLLPHPAHEQHNPFSAGYPVPRGSYIPTPAQQYYVQEPVVDTLQCDITNAFRGAARAYLCAVVNGWNPRVKEVMAAVNETINALRNINSTKMHPVDRALVLPLFIAGVLTDDHNQRMFVHARLSNIDFRQCGSFDRLLEVLDGVWRARHHSGGREVCFRDIMMDINTMHILIA